MNQILQKAISELAKLSEAEQEEIALYLLDLTAKKQIDAQLLAAELRGGTTSSSDLFKSLRQKYAM
jgi:hypothetical protein